LQIVCTLLALAAAAPLEDTAEVAAAKAVFQAAFAAATAGEHAALRPDADHPVNTDTQAAQIAAAYLDDVEDVATAKAAFAAAFEDAAAGGLAAKQAPAPVHVLPVPAPLVAAPVAVAAPFHHGYAGLHGAYPFGGYAGHLGYPGAYAGYPAGFGYAGHLGYAGAYAGHHLGFPYTNLPVAAAAAE
jgi:hypothetical protein